MSYILIITNFSAPCSEYTLYANVNMNVGHIIMCLNTCVDGDIVMYSVSVIRSIYVWVGVGYNSF